MKTPELKTLFELVADMKDIPINNIDEVTVLCYNGAYPAGKAFNLNNKWWQWGGAVQKWWVLKEEPDQLETLEELMALHSDNKRYLTTLANLKEMLEELY